jgi:hypothetical protein
MRGHREETSTGRLRYAGPGLSPGRCWSGGRSPEASRLALRDTDGRRGPSPGRSFCWLRLLESGTPGVSVPGGCWSQVGTHSCWRGSGLGELPECIGASVDPTRPAEAFDQNREAARLAVPGGPAAREARRAGAGRDASRFPRPMLDRPGWNFSVMRSQDRGVVATRGSDSRRPAREPTSHCDISAGRRRERSSRKCAAAVEQRGRPPRSSVGGRCRRERASFVGAAALGASASGSAARCIAPGVLHGHNAAR